MAARSTRARRGASEPERIRRRRSPEEAKAEILDAAERIVAERGPDGVGLKTVAEAAGVSHGLVTHYFGTYEALVREVLDRRLKKAREEALAKIAAPDWTPETGSPLPTLFALLEDPVHVRLATWALLSGREDHPLFPLEKGSLEKLVEGLTAHRTRRVGKGAAREKLKAELEDVVLIALSAAYGFALGKGAFLPALGKRSGPEELERFQGALERLIRGALDSSEPTPRRG